MNKNLRYSLCFSYLLFYVFVVYGQRDSLKSSLLRDVLGKSEIKQTAIEELPQVIAASRFLENADDLPFRIYIITREEIMANGYKTLVDALKTAPGVKVSQPGSAELGETFLMRGLIGNEYCKILLNGQPLQPSTLGGLPIGAQLPIRQAERIEIIYGPSAAIYGADATVGVINIITKESNLSSYAQGDIELGMNGYRYLNFTVGGKLGKNKNILNYSFYGNRGERRNLNLLFKNIHRRSYNPLEYLVDLVDTSFSDVSISDTVAFMDTLYQPFYEGSATWPLIRDMPQESRLVGINLSFRGLKFEFENMYRRDHSSIGRTPFLFSYANPISYIGESLQRMAVSYTKENEKMASTTQISYLRYRLDNNSSYSITYPGGNRNGVAFIYSASDDILAEQLLNFKVNDAVSILSGASFQYSGNLPIGNDLPERFNPSDYIPFSRTPISQDPFFGEFGQNPIRYYNVAAFSQVQMSLASLEAVGSLRYDYNSRYGSTLNPRVALLWRNQDGDTRFYANYGRAFRAPAPNTAFRSVAFRIDSTRSAYAVVPQANLQPEIFQSFEIGTRQKLNNRLEMNFSYFRNVITNLISSTFVEVDRELYPTAVDSITRTVVNSRAANAKLRGYQLSLVGKNLIPAVRLSSSYHFTRSRGEEILPRVNESQSEVETLDVLRMTPKNIHQWQISLYPTKDLYINLRQNWMSRWLRRYTPTLEASRKELYTNNRYYNLDMLVSYQLGSQIRVYVDMRNVLNAEYSGIGATGLDIDAFVNPQQSRFFLLGLSFDMD